MRENTRRCRRKEAGDACNLLDFCVSQLVLLLEGQESAQGGYRRTRRVRALGNNRLRVILVAEVDVIAVFFFVAAAAACERSLRFDVFNVTALGVGRA